uniref:28 kDa Metastriate family member n=1 Tax=Rhipicephalus appendiculatus TaxID=34631 RepID=A0A131YPI1_RHIAP
MLAFSGITHFFIVAAEDRPIEVNAYVLYDFTNNQQNELKRYHGDGPSSYFSTLFQKVQQRFLELTVNIKIMVKEVSAVDNMTFYETTQSKDNVVDREKTLKNLEEYWKRKNLGKHAVIYLFVSN